MNERLLDHINFITSLASVAGTIGFAIAIIFGQPTETDKITFGVGLVLLILVLVGLVSFRIKSLQKQLVTAKSQFENEIAVKRSRISDNEKKLYNLESCMINHSAIGHRLNHRLRDSSSWIANYQIEYYSKLNEAKSLDDIDSICEKYKEESEKILCDFTRCATTSIIEKLNHYDRVRNIQEDYRIFIELVNPDDSKPIRDWEVVNVIMDNATWEKYGHLIKNISNPTVNQNAGFEALAVMQARCYVYNDLSVLNLHSKPVHMYVDVDGFEKNDAICMVPIRSYTIENEISRRFYGFLVVDCKNDSKSKVFSDSRDSVVFNSLAQEADAIASVCIALDNAVQHLDNLSNDRRGRFYSNRRKNDNP